MAGVKLLFSNNISNNSCNHAMFHLNKIEHITEGGEVLKRLALGQ